MTHWKDPLGSVTSWTRRADGQPTSRTLPNGRVTNFDYDVSGNVTEVHEEFNDATWVPTDSAGISLPPEMRLRACFALRRRGQSLGDESEVEEGGEHQVDLVEPRGDRRKPLSRRNRRSISLRRR